MLAQKPEKKLEKTLSKRDRFEGINVLNNEQ